MRKLLLFLLYLGPLVFAQTPVSHPGTPIPFNNTYYVPNPALPTTICGLNWQQSPGGSISVGANTVTLSCAPPGLLTGAEVGALTTDFTHIAVAGTGTPEYPIITATSCPQHGSSAFCTVTFTATGAHGTGFTIGTASSGLQETINSAMRDTSAFVGPYLYGLSDVRIPPGDYILQATVGIPEYYGSTRLDFTGAVLYCYMSASCALVGDSVRPSWSAQMQIENIEFMAEVTNGDYAALEDNGQAVTVDGISAMAATPTDSFGALEMVDTDEAFVIKRLNTQVGGFSPYHCGTDFCSEAIYIKSISPEPTGSIQDSNISMAKGNGIDALAGNGLHISNVVIQAISQFFIRSRGGFGTNLNVQLDNIYEEGPTTNPLGTGTAGLAASSGVVIWNGNEGGAAGAEPLFSNTGATQYNYYAIAIKGGKPSVPLAFGYALSNGSDSPVLVWPDAGTADHWTILRTSGDTPFAPTGTLAGGSPTASGSVAVGLVGSSVCNGITCTFTDTASANTSSYVVPGPSTNFYYPSLIGTHGATVGSSGVPPWPGTLVLSGTEDTALNSGTFAEVSSPFLSQGVFGSVGDGPLSIVNAVGANLPAISADFCFASVNWSPVWLNCRAIMTTTEATNQLNVPSGSAPVAFSTLPACGAYPSTEGLTNAVSDSTTSVLGATVTGGGSSHVQAYCNGTNWVVGAGSTAGSAFSGSLGASYQDVTEISTPGNPASGTDRLYLNSATHLLSCLTSLGGSCSPNLQFIFGNAGPSITALTIPNGDSLTFSGTGTNNASSINGITVTGTPSVGWVPTATSGTTATWQATGSGTAFSAITSSTNTTAAMVLGTGSSLTVSGSGTNNATTLLANTWAIPGTIGSTTPNTGAFTTLSATSTVSGAGFSAYLASPPAIGGSAAAAGTFTTLLASSSITDSALTPGNCVQAGTAGLLTTTGGACGAGGGGVSSVYGSTGTITALTIPSGDSLDVSGTGTNNATTLLAGTWAIPGTIGSSTPNTGAFTTLSASSTVSGTGFSTYLASPPAIGGSAPAAGSFTALTGTSVTDSALTTGNCVQASTGGLLTTTSAPCPSSGGVTSVYGSTGAITALTIPSGDSLTVSGTGTNNATTLLAGTWAIPGTIGSTTKNTGAFTTLLASTSITDSGLTSGNCVQAGTAGLLTTTAGPCGAGGGGVSSVFGSTGTITTLTIPSGDSLTVSGTGTNNATSINGITITGTPTTGNVPTATSSSAATWQAPAGAPWFNVVTFGAVGNGTTPDQVAIQAAINACGSAGGGTVLFPGNTYLIGAQLNFSQNNCGLYSFNHEGILKKGFNGDILSVTGTNQSIHGLTLDDQGASFTGRDINASGATQIFIEFNVIKNQANSTYFTGVTGATITHNWITSGTAGGGIFGEKNSIRFRITDNYIDVSPYTGGNAKDITGHATTPGQSLSDWIIANNMLIGPSGTGTFNVEIGGFNGNMADHITITGNVMRETIGADGAISLDSTNHFTIAGNTIYNVGADLSIGCIEIVGSNYGSVVGTTCHNGGFKGGIICNTCNFVGFDNNVVDGFSPTGGDQAFFGPSTSKAGVGITSTSESGNVVTIVASGALPSELYPGQVVFISGVTLTTPVRGEYNGYNGLCTHVLTVNLGTNTITCTWPISGLGSSSGGNIGWSASHNSFSNNKVIFPEGATTGTLRGWWSQCNVASATCSNNTWSTNHCFGTAQATQNCVQLERDSGTLDSDLFVGNQFENLTNGISIGSGVTNVSVEETVTTGVTTPLNASSGSVVESDLPIAFGNLAACTSGLEGNTAPVTDDTQALAWNAHVNGGGSFNVHAFCDGSNWVMQ